ncbi:MAG: PspC domain-containing protein [Chloroflexi bacterium]|nr:PspC domain-containing protein [Chloroflexota bacterium]
MRERLYRSREERVVFGVAGGVADWLDVDPALVRIVFALLVFAGGIGFFLYVVMAIVVPEEPSSLGAPPMPGDPAAPATPVSEAAAAAPSAAPSMPSGQAFVDARAARRAARRTQRAEGDGRGVVIFGAILIVIGAWFLLDRYLTWLDSDLLGPVVLIVIGALLLAGALGRGRSGTPTGPG